MGGQFRSVWARAKILDKTKDLERDVAPGPSWCLQTQRLIQINEKATCLLQITGVFKSPKGMSLHSFSYVSNIHVIRFEVVPHK